MMVWIQLAFFIITNLPGLIRSLKELMQIFRGDRALARMALREMQTVKNHKPGLRKERLKAIIDKYADKCSIGC